MLEKYAQNKDIWRLVYVGDPTPQVESIRLKLESIFSGIRVLVTDKPCHDNVNIPLPAMSEMVEKINKQLLHRQ